jgi:hypothetical protein
MLKESNTGLLKEAKRLFTCVGGGIILLKNKGSLIVVESI